MQTNLIDYHYKKQGIGAYSLFSEECGDIGVIVPGEHVCFLALVDALGHGAIAQDIADRAAAYLHQHAELNLVELLQGLHQHLQGSRGAVAALCRLDRKTGLLQYTGIGNITLRLYNHTQQTLLTKDGILGYMIPTPVRNEVQMYPGDIFIMSSDGIREHFHQEEYPDLLMGSAEEICNRFMTVLNKQLDDASCIVLRFGI